MLSFLLFHPTDDIVPVTVIEDVICLQVGIIGRIFHNTFAVEEVKMLVPITLLALLNIKVNVVGAIALSALVTIEEGLITRAGGEVRVIIGHFPFEIVIDGIHVTIELCCIFMHTFLQVRIKFFVAATLFTFLTLEVEVTRQRAS